MQCIKLYKMSIKFCVVLVMCAITCLSEVCWYLTWYRESIGQNIINITHGFLSVWYQQLISINWYFSCSCVRIFFLFVCFFVGLYVFFGFVCFLCVCSFVCIFNLFFSVTELFFFSLTACYFSFVQFFVRLQVGSIHAFVCSLIHSYMHSFMFLE